jgi:hypothetical protein
MTQYTAEDFRLLVNRLNEVIFDEDAADDSEPQDDGEPIDKMLTQPKDVSSAEVTEGEDDVTHEPASIDDVEKAITTASDASPVAKLQATKLVKHLIDGMSDKHKNGGISHVMSGIVDSITAAQNGQEAEALKHIASMVNHVEGDEHAIDGKVFPSIVVTLMLLVGDILQHNEK